MDDGEATGAPGDARPLTGAAARRFAGDAGELAAELSRRVAGEVSFADGVRSIYARDASHYRQVPIGVVFPRDAGDVEAALAVCRAAGAPVLLRGAGTSLAGQCCNVAVVLDVSRHLNRVLEIDPDRRVARVEPGMVLDRLQAAAAPHGLLFGPDPSSHAACTLGGMIGNNACGTHSLTAGRTADNVEALEVLTCDGLRLAVGPTGAVELAAARAEGGRRGAIYDGLATLAAACGDEVRRRYPAIPRRVSGYNLDELLPERGFQVARALVGSEGTCATILSATLRLVPAARARVLVILGFADLPAAADAVPAVLDHGPIGLEAMGDALIDNLRRHGIEPDGVDLLPPGRGWLLVEMAGDTATEARSRAAGLVAKLGRLGSPSHASVEDPRLARRVWQAREAAVGASARLAGGGDTWPGFEDAAVPPARLGAYLRDFTSLLDRHGYRSTLYGHFGQGCVHARIDFDLASRDGVGRYRAFVEEAADLVVGYGGSLSGEHGDGQSRAELLGRMFGPELLDAFRRFKAIWDPAGRMNPGKVVDPYPLDADLQPGAGRPAPVIASHFRYPGDEGSFARAVGRCIGVGRCRRETGGTMCPSFMATRDERHSTRGRARLLQALADGELSAGWRSTEVKEALDLCLACKGCRRDCPAGVDVATYKAEFLARHHRGRWRPRDSWVFGLAHVWLRLAGRLPGAANTLLDLPGVEALLKIMAGIAAAPRLPRLAQPTLGRLLAAGPAGPDRGWGAKHVDPAAPGRRPRVVVWPDTFNRYLRPSVVTAALRVLDRAGFAPVLPAADLCCGRPLYDQGLLGLARKRLARCLEVLGPELERGTPIVGLEPSCLAVFRDELPQLVPGDAARRLAASSLTLAELLTRHAPGYRPPRLAGRALFHPHCHHQAVMGTAADLELLAATGLEVELPEAGCCGMAGAFGFARATHALSRTIAERAFLPAVRGLATTDLLITDGFSCGLQAATAGARAVHLAELLAGSDGADGEGRGAAARTPSTRRD